MASAAAEIVRSGVLSVDCDLFERHAVVFNSCSMMRKSIVRSCWNLDAESRVTRYQPTSRWKIRFALNMNASPAPETGGQEIGNENTPEPGRTRLGVIVRAASKQLLDRLNTARKNFPLKIFLLLFGFYTANALATILGQTGDWDVIVAGVVVAAIEGIGMLMYKKPMSPNNPSGRIQSLVVMINYWKAGVCLGLFVDAFKLGS